MKNCLVSLAVLFLVFIPSLHTYTGSTGPGIHDTIMTTSPSTLPTSTYASFNDSYTQCLGKDGNYYWGTIYQTFAPVVYTPCQSQMLSDIDYLNAHNIKTIRLWPVLSTFAYNSTTQTWSSTFNSNITNLDQVLSRLAMYKMKAYITVMAVPACDDPPEISTDLGYYFNPSLINNSVMQDQFIQALQAFITRYKDSPAIYGYDLVNEMSLVLENSPTKTSRGYCNLSYDTADFTKTRALLARMYTTAKSVDPIHSFTYSFDHLYPSSSPVFTAMSNNIDFYDFHAYSNNPAAFYQNFPTYNKPVIDGEAGVYGTQHDRYGNDCEGTGTNAYRNLLPAMPSECQANWLANTQAFVQQAKLHKIQALFFQMWPAIKAFGVRLYDTSNTFTGYQLTSAGTYIFSLPGA